MPKGLLVCFYEHGIKALNQISNPFWPPPPKFNPRADPSLPTHTPHPPRSHAYTVLFKPTTNEDKFTNVTQDYIMVLKNGISDINVVVIFKK